MSNIDIAREYIKAMRLERQETHWADSSQLT